MIVRRNLETVSLELRCLSDLLPFFRGRVTKIGLQRTHRILGVFNAPGVNLFSNLRVSNLAGESRATIHRESLSHLLRGAVRPSPVTHIKSFSGTFDIKVLVTSPAGSPAVNEHESQHGEREHPGENYQVQDVGIGAEPIREEADREHEADDQNG